MTATSTSERFATPFPAPWWGAGAAVARPTAVPSVRSTMAQAAFIGAHVLIGVAVRQSVTVASAYGWLLILVGLAAVAFAPPPILLAVSAYVAGAEVLWRMCGALVPWESTKYLLVLLSIAGLVRATGRASLRFLPLAYVGALLPSVLVIAADGTYKLPAIIGMLGFNLGAPVALGLGAWFASTLHLSRDETRRVLAAGIAPVVGIAAVTAFTTYTAAALTFDSESNFVTSGGYGPNQVSVMLSLGALYSLVAAVEPNAGRMRRVAGALLALGCLTQSVMTFSRGGLWSAVGALAAGAVFFVQARATRRVFLVGLAVAAVVFGGVVFPRLNDATGGALEQRFSKTTTTHRDEIAAEDWRLFGEHPVLGLGPGGAQRERRTIFRISHTEYSRLLAEHGMFGVLALFALAAMALAALRTARSNGERGMRAVFLAWSLLSMAHVGMRVGALAFAFAFGCVRASELFDEAPP